APTWRAFSIACSCSCADISMVCTEPPWFLVIVANVWSNGEKVLTPGLLQELLVRGEERLGDGKELERLGPRTGHLRLALGHGQREVELAQPELVAVVGRHAQLNGGRSAVGRLAARDLLPGKVDHHRRGGFRHRQPNDEVTTIGR